VLTADPHKDSRSIDAVPRDIAQTARRLAEGFIAWLGQFGERSLDPYDFWACSAGRKAKRLYYRHRRVGAIAALPFVFLDTWLPKTRQLVAAPRRYPIADAHYAIAFFRWSDATGDRAALRRGEHFLTQLEQQRCPGFAQYCWGYPFDWESRGGTVAAQTPLITTVPYAYEAFEAGHAATRRPRYLEAMESVATFAFDQIPTSVIDRRAAAAGYTPTSRSRVINASSYRGYLLTTAGRRFVRADWIEAADRNIAFVLDSQRADGSWAYSAEERFVDNFHTCFVLKNLVKTWSLTQRADLLDSVRRGYDFYLTHLLDQRGQPVPFAVRPRMSLQKRDLYDYAEGINLAHLLCDLLPGADSTLRGLLMTLESEWVLPDGHFMTRQVIGGRNVVPYHRWAQAQTFCALTALCDAGR
jgi:hypothetical protein